MKEIPCDGKLLLSMMKNYQQKPFHINPLKPRQNCRHFPEDISKCIFLSENVWISIKISLNFVPKGLMNSIPGLIQTVTWLMAWRRPGDKLLSECLNALTNDS